MVYLLKVLSDIAREPLATFSIQICPNPNSKLGPTDSFYPEPPSSFDIATARNPNSSVTPIRISVPPRWPCQRSVIYCIRFGLTDLASQILFCLLLHFDPIELMQSVPPG